MMDAVKLAIAGGILLAGSLVAVALGALPLRELAAVADRVAPILAFVVAISVVAELATRAGVFDVAASWLARLSRGRTWLLWLSVAALSVVTTAFLSLDTTAVLLTPVVVAVARANGLPPLPFALTTIWLANTGSLFLPISNLTNLLAADRMPEGGPTAFAALMAPSAVAAVLTTLVVLGVLHRRSLAGRYVVSDSPRIADRVQLVGSSVIVVAVLPLLVSGLPPWIPAACAALALTALFAWRAPRALSPRLIPWSLLVFAAGLFAAVAAAEALGSGRWIAAVAGTGSQTADVWRMAAAGLTAANAVDNLPAYLLLESTAHDTGRLPALLIGVNAGPLITPWASLATLLWHDRLRAVGVQVSWGRFAVWGLVAAPVIVAASVAALVWL